jgi:hypothetical protein
MAFNSINELKTFLDNEIDRNYQEHFGSPPS